MYLDDGGEEWLPWGIYVAPSSGKSFASFG
jgi:hypothetical protein